ncbi:hypothetical protein [Hyphomicrobium sp. MC8b]
MQTKRPTVLILLFAILSTAAIVQPAWADCPPPDIQRSALAPA